MSDEASADAPQDVPHSSRLGLLLAAAMFVLVVDTSLMNVSISAVVKDLDTTVSGVQSAIALEALVSAAFILISSKVGDLIGRKKAYVLGLLAYATGALAMTLAQNLIDRKIRVNCVAPGPIWTPLIPSTSAEKAAKHGAKVPMERPGQPEEVAPSFVFFASEADSSYITGEILTLTGGEISGA